MNNGQKVKQCSTENHTEKFKKKPSMNSSAKVVPFYFNTTRFNCMFVVLIQSVSLKSWVQAPSWQGVLDATLCDKICQWLSAGRSFSPGTQFFPTNKTDRHDITEILLTVALNTQISKPYIRPIKLSYNNIYWPIWVTWWVAYKYPSPAPRFTAGFWRSPCCSSF
jgi:hypothetical protein